jgi:hypothetical protein
MKEWYRWLIASLLLVLFCSFAWIHMRRSAVPAVAAQPPQSPAYAEQEQARQMVTVTGPLADYISRRPDVETLQPAAHPVSYSASGRPLADDHVHNDSPVGTSTSLLHRTFNVADIADLPFELPPHASTPNLRGTYQSFLPRSGQTGVLSDDQAEVEFLLLSETQYAELIHGRPVNPIFSVDAASNGEVDFTMPPTYGRPAKYFLVFRNSAPDKGKKAVQADFRIDF